MLPLPAQAAARVCPAGEVCLCLVPFFYLFYFMSAIVSAFTAGSRQKLQGSAPRYASNLPHQPVGAFLIVVVLFRRGRAPVPVLK